MAETDPSVDLRASYQLRMRAHLARYKEDVLGIKESGVWKIRGRTKTYAHILPVGEERLNIIESARTEFWQFWERERLARPALRLHRDFAHLTSSQALAFNLFFPFLRSSQPRSAPLLAALGVHPRPIKAWGFELVLDSAEGTHFDAGITFESNERLLVEVKLTEAEFGSCKPDAAHRKKLNSVYAPRLESRVEPEALRPDTFFQNYQVLRNICYAGPQADVVFLLPRANTSLGAGVTVIRSAPLAPVAPHVRVAFLEDVLDALSLGIEDNGLASVVKELSSKYHLGRGNSHAGRNDSPNNVRPIES